MKAWAVVEAGAPLELIDVPTPIPTGTEVLVEVTHCGVCHSDLHFVKGEYNMGGGKVMKIADRGVTLPRAPGHEIAGRVAAVGPEVQGVAEGDVRVVYPWLGCGHCSACAAEMDNLCTQQRSLGVVQHGGFADYVLVPHPRYLVDPGQIDPGLAATYACSGLTAHAAVRKILPLEPAAAVLVIGAGGVGLTIVAMLRALGHRNVVSADRDEDRQAAAIEAGATSFVQVQGEGAAAQVRAATDGPIAAAIDVVGITATATLGLSVLHKGGKLVVVGVSGGELVISLAETIFRALSIIGTNTGSLHDLRAVIALANSGKLKPVPLTCRPTDEANQALSDLKAGLVAGRQVLVS